MTLRWKYIFFTVLILIVIVSVFSCYNLRYQERLIKEDDIRRVELITEIIKNGLFTIMLEGRGKEFQKFLESLIAEEIEEVRIFDLYSGKILASSIPTEIGKEIYKEDRERFAKQKFPEVFSHIKDGSTVYSMLVPIRNNVACQKCHTDGKALRGILDVEISMKKTLQRINELRKRTILFSLMTSLSLAIALAVMTTLLVNRPVEGIIRTMRRVQEGDFSVRFLTKRKDEIGKLADALNRMLDELDRARKEIQRCHLEEMKRVERMATLGELAAAVAHEIKNPLAGISGAIQVIYEDLNEDDPKKEVMSEVLNEIERLDKTVRDLLFFARPTEPKKVEIDIMSIIDRCINLIKPKADKQNIKIENKIQENVTLKIDPQQIQQAIINIMMNAINAMPSGGIMRLSSQRIDDYIEISISDTGEGISPEELKKVFKPFYTIRHAGTGLGLSISRNIIEAHGGMISVDSTPGMGTTFKIKLPV
jgi:signal transduction histidine kinase